MKSIAENNKAKVQKNSPFFKGQGATMTRFSASVIQPKLTIGAPNDKYEREADAMADKVMRMPQNTAAIQKKCAGCDHEEKIQTKRKGNFLSLKRIIQKTETPEEDALRTKPLMMKSEGAGGVATSSLASQLNSTKGSGSPLSASTNNFMSNAFASNFSEVRVHTDSNAIQMNEGLNARAFTHGSDVYFNKGQYSPSSSEGKRLLGHELTHVVQQGGGNELRRQLSVESPGTNIAGSSTRENWEDVRDYMSVLSPAFNVASSGQVSPSSAGGGCASTTSITDRCLCDLHNSSHTWKIKIDNTEWPHTEDANKRVSVHSSQSVAEFGAWGGGAQDGQRLMLSNARVLGHELCGHAWLFERGIHPVRHDHAQGGRLMGRPSHNSSVTMENLVAQDISGPNAQQRGTFGDSHHGESFAKITITDFPTNSSDLSTLPSAIQDRLTEIARFMNDDPVLRADIIGHSDNTGAANINRRVSRRRARSVLRHLRNQGIPRSRFLVVRGNSNADCPPIPADNSNCRKVEVFLYVYQGASERFP